MIPVRTIALALAISVAAVASSAQEATTPLTADHSPSGISQAALSPRDNDALAEARASALEAPMAFVAPVVQPQVTSEHNFWDRQQKLALMVHGAMRVADTTKTCRELAHGGREVWIPTQSCAGIAAWNAGSVGVALGVGWLFHKYGFHRLERITPWVGTSASAAGLTKSVFNIR